MERAIVMYTDYYGSLFSDESTALTPYPIHIEFDELGMVIIFPQLAELDLDDEVEEDSENVD